MKVKEFITKIKQHQNFDVLDKLLRTTKDEYQKKYSGKKVNLHHNYTKELFWYRVDNVKSGLPEYVNQIRFTMGLFEITAFVTIEINPYERHMAKVLTTLSFSCDRLYKLFWDKKWELPANLNLDNTESMVKTFKKILQKDIIPEGYLNDVQYRRACSVFDLKIYYKKLMDYNNPNEFSYDLVDKWMLRHFNVKSNGYTIEAIKFINKRGKQKEIVSLHRFDTSFIHNFEGDIDEAESYFYDEMEQYPKNAILI